MIPLAKDEKVVKKTAKIKAKKKWVQILAPRSYDYTPLGETNVEDGARALGKSITVNLMNLSGDMRKQSIEIRFDIIKIHEGKAHTAATAYDLVPSALKRIVRRGRAKISDSFIVKTATGRLVRIKPIVITANAASNGACTEIRLAARERIKQIVAGMSFDRLVHELIEYRLQRVVKDAVEKTHPVKSVEVKSCILLPEGEKREIREDTRDEDFITVKPEAPKPATETPAAAE